MESYDKLRGSQRHRQTQAYLMRQLGTSGKAEVRFQKLGRIADIVYEEKKVIFEIQCSAIVLDEIQARNRAYASIDYRVVWVFHVDAFTPSVCRYGFDFPHYFTDITFKGHGMIFDCLDEKCAFHPIVPAAPFLYDASWKLPRILKKRFKNWQIGFQGDMVDLIMQGKDIGLKKETLGYLDPWINRLWRLGR